MLATLTVPITVMRMRFKPSAARRLFDTSAWVDPAFVVFAMGSFLGSIGLYIPYFYVGIFDKDHRIVRDKQLNFYLLPLINAGSVFGRIVSLWQIILDAACWSFVAKVLSYCADKIGTINILIVASLGSAIFGFIWIAVKTTSALILFCILYGFFSGAFISLSLSVVSTKLCPHAGLLGVRIGMICYPTAIGFLVGAPVAGIIVRHSWFGVQIFCGGSVALATVGVILVRFLKAGRDLWAKIWFLDLCVQAEKFKSPEKNALLRITDSSRASIQGNDGLYICLLNWWFPPWSFPP